MPPAPGPSRHENDIDHAVWLQCFRAALAHGLASSGPMETVQGAVAVADLALREEQRRRPVLK